MKTHLRVPHRWDRALDARACAATVRAYGGLTNVLARVNCKSCRLTEAFREALRLDHPNA